jgi:hypothetical protein
VKGPQNLNRTPLLITRPSRGFHSGRVYRKASSPCAPPIAGIDLDGGMEPLISCVRVVRDAILDEKDIWI